MCFLIQHQCRFAKPLHLSQKSHTTPTVFHLLGHLHFHWRQLEEPNVITSTSKTRQLKSRLEIWGWNKEALEDVWNMIQEKQRYIFLAEPCSVSMGREREEKQPHIRKTRHMDGWMEISHRRQSILNVWKAPGRKILSQKHASYLHPWASQKSLLSKTYTESKYQVPTTEETNRKSEKNLPNNENRKF